MLIMDMTQVDVTITLHDVPVKVTGWSDSSDCLSLPDSSELNMFKKGATGKMVASGTGEKGGEVSLKILANSPFVDAMSAEIGLIKAGSQFPIFIHIQNKTVGDYIECINGVLKTAPDGVTYGKGEVGEMVYVLEFETIAYVPATSKRGSVISNITGGLAG